MIRVLCVDDEHCFQELCTEFIDRAGDMQGIAVGSAEEALAELEINQFDAVVSDFQMSGMDGIELLKKLRESGNKIPFILFTGKGREEVIIEALNNGADFYLQKGLDNRAQFAELINGIRQMVKKHRAELALRESEEKYRILSDNVRDYIWYLNMNLDWEYVSPSVKDILGYSPEEVTGLSFERLIAPESLEMVEGQILKMIVERGLWELEGDVSENFLVEMRHKEGSTRWVENRVTVLWDHEGNPKGLMGVARDVTKRKIAEEALISSMDVLAQIIQGTLIPAFVIDQDHQVTHWNPALEALTGIATEDILGTRDHWRGFYSEERPLMADLVIEEASEEDFNRYYSGRFHRSMKLERSMEAEGFFPNLGNGTWLYLTATPLLNREGRIIGAIETTQDITLSKQTEEALRESEARYRTIFENTGSAMVMIGEDSNVLVNSEFERLSGYSKDELKHIVDLNMLLHEEDRQNIMDYYFDQEYDPESVPSHFDLSLKCKNGDSRQCLVSMSMIHGTKDRVVSMIDVTEMRAMEQKLAMTLEGQAALLDNIDTQVWLATDPETYGSANTARANFIDLAKEEIEGKRLRDVLNRDDAELCIESNRLAFRGETVTRSEWIKTSKGELRCSLVTKIPVKNEKGDIEYVVCTAKDITDYERAKQSVEQLNDVLRLVNGILRHDMLNELSVIGGAIELYTIYGEDKFLGKALDAVKRSSNLINRMREFEYLISRGEKMEERLIGDAMKCVLERNSIDHSVKGECRIMADNALESALENIVRNAIVHGEATKIEVEVKNENGTCITSIVDDGIGIPDDLKERIFEEGFKHGDRGGTGLGLYLVKKMMERYQGEISVSDNMPRGAIFELRFPIPERESFR